MQEAKKEFWILSTSALQFDNSCEHYDTKEEAIANMEKELAPLPHMEVYVARCKPLDLEWAKKNLTVFRPDDIGEQLSEECGEIGFEFEENLTYAEIESLNTKFVEMIYELHDPGYYSIEDIERIKEKISASDDANNSLNEAQVAIKEAQEIVENLPQGVRDDINKILNETA